MKALLVALAGSAAAFTAPPTWRGARAARHGSLFVSMQHSKGWDGFGKGPFKYYNNFEAFMAPFPDEDREEYPEMFRLPKGVYEVALPKPLGIAFEEKEPGAGVVVDYLVEGGNAASSGKIQPGDVLILVTAIKVFGPRWERKLLPAIDMPFDVIMGAISSNEPRYQVSSTKGGVQACNAPGPGPYLDPLPLPGFGSWPLQFTWPWPWPLPGPWPLP